MAGIRISGLSKKYGGQNDEIAAVNDLNLEIRDNQFVTLLGPSGCGKTTTLRLIAGYIRPDSGEIYVGDRLVSSQGGVVPPERREMGMVFQNYAVWPHKTVFENVVFGLKVRKVSSAKARDLVAKALDLVNMSGLDLRYPGELSGGQQQRVALARSLVVEPEILLLDEPLSNLDAKLRERMRKELKELQRRTRITFVYVTHDQAEALALSDMIAVMQSGRLQQYGSPYDVYRKPASKAVADFMGLINVLQAVTSGSDEVVIDGKFRVAATLPAGCKPDEIVDLTVRPESVRLTSVSEAAPGSLTATVTDHTFLGNINEYQATLASGQILRVQTHPLQHLSIGEPVSVAFDASQCSIFRRDPL